MARHRQSLTPESEESLPKAETPKKRKSSQVKLNVIKVKSPPKKIKTSVEKARPKSPESTRAVTPVPQLSEYEKIQLLIANAASEASSSRTRRLRNTSAPQPSETNSHQGHPHKSLAIAVHSKTNVPPLQHFASTIEEVDTQKSPRSPKIAMYDEWQELLRNAQKEGEAGVGRSRRANKRPPPDETDPSAVRSKSPRKSLSNKIEMDSSMRMHEITHATTIDDEMQVDKPNDQSPTSTSKSGRSEMHEGRIGNADIETMEMKYHNTVTKNRRSVRSVEETDIPKIKSELAVAHSALLSNAQLIPVAMDDMTDVKSKEQTMMEEHLGLTGYKSQPLKTPEAEFLEENRLFMFAILATDGEMGNQRTM
jgi:hypothetical protein